MIGVDCRDRLGMDEGSVWGRFGQSWLSKGKVEFLV
jgi:hypothetical protein